MIKTRFLLLSDTHAKAPFPSTNEEFPFRLPLPSADVLLHAGDLTNVGRNSEYRVTFDMLKDADAELKIVIAGNHDLTLDEAHMEDLNDPHQHMKGQERFRTAQRLWTGEEARRAGIVYLEEEVRTFELRNEAVFTIYASPYTPEFGGWAFPYERDEDRFGPSAVNPIPSHPAIDIILTHGPPHRILDRTFTEKDVGCEYLRLAVKRVKPRLHVFGHIHEGRGAMRQDWVTGKAEMVDWDREKDAKDKGTFLDVSSSGKNGLKWGQETLFVNAAILTVFGKPWNAPWVVDMDLPGKEKEVG